MLILVSKISGRHRNIVALLYCYYHRRRHCCCCWTLQHMVGIGVRIPVIFLNFIFFYFPSHSTFQLLGLEWPWPFMVRHQSIRRMRNCIITIVGDNLCSLTFLLCLMCSWGNVLRLSCRSIVVTSCIPPLPTTTKHTAVHT